MTPEQQAEARAILEAITTNRNATMTWDHVAGGYCNLCRTEDPEDGTDIHADSCPVSRARALLAQLDKPRKSLDQICNEILFGAD